MRELEILEEPPIPNTEAPDSPVNFPVRRSNRPHASTAGIVHQYVQPGEPVSNGDRIAEIQSPHGEHRERIVSMADRDDEELLVPEDGDHNGLANLVGRRFESRILFPQ